MGWLIQQSEQRISGILSLQNKTNQTPTEDIGIYSFEFWSPSRRPKGQNAALTINPPIDGFGAGQIKNGLSRPVKQSNIWVASLTDPTPSVTLTWESNQTIKVIDICFDADWDHAMESSLMGHPEYAMPFCVKKYPIRNHRNELIWDVQENHQPLNHIVLPDTIITKELRFEILEMNGDTPPAIFEIRC